MPSSYLHFIVGISIELEQITKRLEILLVVHFYCVVHFKVFIVDERITRAASTWWYLHLYNS